MSPENKPCAACAAKDAALEDMVAIAAARVIQFPADGYFRQLYDIGGAALSPSAGEGWVRREVLAQKIEALGAVVFAEDDKEREMLAKCVVLTVIRNAPVDAALDALKKGK